MCVFHHVGYLFYSKSSYFPIYSLLCNRDCCWNKDSLYNILYNEFYFITFLFILIVFTMSTTQAKTHTIFRQILKDPTLVITFSVFRDLPLLHRTIKEKSLETRFQEILVAPRRSIGKHEVLCRFLRPPFYLPTSSTRSLLAVAFLRIYSCLIKYRILKVNVSHADIRWFTLEKR